MFVFVAGVLLMFGLNLAGGNESKFRACLNLKALHLRNALSTYMCNASDCTENDFTLILSPAMTVLKQSERPAKFIGASP